MFITRKRFKELEEEHNFLFKENILLTKSLFALEKHLKVKRVYSYRNTPLTLASGLIPHEDVIVTYKKLKK